MSSYSNLSETVNSHLYQYPDDTPIIHCKLEWTCDGNVLSSAALRKIGLPEYVDYNVTNMTFDEVQGLIERKRFFVKDALGEDFDEYFTPGVSTDGVFCGCRIIKISLNPITSEVAEVVDGELELDIPSMRPAEPCTEVFEDDSDIW